MNYLLWAVLAMSAYAMVAPLTKLALDGIPTPVVVLITNAVLIVAAVGVVLVAREPVGAYLTHARAPYMYAAGLFLTIGIMSYYQALSLGPVSIVVPIFGLFIVVSSVIGVFALDESLTLRKGLGVVLAIAAIILTSLD